ncbi:hypothetical protein JTE90_017936 [Oedothorax gibbosus]|uniref:Uncharacterized protein n=1 Tax=Oedothorax gibbosus TaxID=931172 RepID=A0AAV6V6V4_9ARAC|nr:hypothetical protein JTE90_017936 [Oedothorax gibbosus]
MACTFLNLIQLMLQWREGALKKEMKEYDPDELLESGLSQSWAQGNGADEFSQEIELQEMPKARSSSRAGPSSAETKCSSDNSDSSSPERPPDPTSVVRRRSSVGIQRQASVCLSDEEDQAYDNFRKVPETIAEHQKGHEPRPKEVTRVAAIVHRSANEKAPLPPHSWEQSSACSSSFQSFKGARHPPFIHSYSSPDSGTAAKVADTKQGRVCSTISLRGIPPETLTRVVDLEDYHYSRQQVWELVTQGSTLLKEKSQSNLDIAAEAEDPSNIQEAASTEAGLLEKSLEQHQLEHLQVLLKRYSPVEEEDVEKIWSKVRYNDTGSREDIREEVIEMISGESSDDSHGSVENELLKQQSRQLWELRATLEEEEDKLSDTQEAEEDPPPEKAIVGTASTDLPDIMSTHATSMESNADVSCDDPGYECDESDYLQLPSHELRRHSYKSLLNKRAKKTPGAESSLDSWDSSSTDRTEGATTSFESTTDNTDSTGEGQTNRLQQMKADSGYKSMESNGKAPRLCRKQLQFNLEGESVDSQMMTTMEGTFDEEIDTLFKNPPEVQVTDTIKTKMESSKVVSFEGGVTIEGEGLPPSEPQVHKKKYKSALKKHCTESDIQWSDQISVEQQLSVPGETKGKTSVFQRFFRTGRLRMDQLQKYRDYSIDEKSDALFREFSRPDSEGDHQRSRGPRLHGHMRLHHRSLPSTESSTSPHLPKKLLSPHVSIEEETGENEGEEVAAVEVEKPEGATSSHEETQVQISVICHSQGGEEQ